MIQQKKGTTANANTKTKSGKAEVYQSAPRAQVEKPTLPLTLERMLRRTGEDKNLVSIQVSFFARGMQELHFVVDDGGATKTLTAGEYQSYRHKVKPQMEQTKVNLASEAFFRKLEARCWIKSQDDSEIHARTVKALKWPPVIATAFSFSQSDVKVKKLTPSRMFAIWTELKTKDPKGFEEICEFQRQVDPRYEWEENLKSYALFAQKGQREEREKKELDAKAALLKFKPIDDWAADEESQTLPLSGIKKAEFKGKPKGKAPPETYDPFENGPPEDSGEDHDASEEEEDPLGRPTSPKPKKGLIGKMKKAVGFDPDKQKTDSELL